MFFEQLEALGLEHVKQGLVNGFYSSVEAAQVKEWIRLKATEAALPPKQHTYHTIMTGPHRYQRIEHEMLSLVLQSSDHLGYATTLGDLTNIFRPTFADIDNRELVDALKRLNEKKYIALCKYQNGQPPCVSYPDQIADDGEFFYHADFRIRRTPQTDPRAQELGALLKQQDDSRASLFKRLEQIGLDFVKQDLMTGGVRWVGGTIEQQEQAREWVLMKEKEKASQAGENAVQKPLSRKVFVVHGHDQAAKEQISRFLERLDFQPIILHEQASRGRTIIEKIEAHADVGFAVVLLTPDDQGCEKDGNPRPRARQNVILELGYFIGHLKRTHVCALKKGDLEVPSDYDGVAYIPFDNSDGWKQALGRELEAAEFEIDLEQGDGSALVTAVVSIDVPRSWLNSRQRCRRCSCRMKKRLNASLISSPPTSATRTRAGPTTKRRAGFPTGARAGDVPTWRR